VLHVVCGLVQFEGTTKQKVQHIHTFSTKKKEHIFTEIGGLLSALSKLDIYLYMKISKDDT
jgi:hypothetical protein